MKQHKLQINLANRQAWFKAYVLVTLFMLAFVNLKEATNFLYDICVPYIEAPVIILHSGILLVFAVITLLISARRFRFDLIGVCMLIKVVLDAIPIFAGKAVFNTYYQFYACTLASFFSYVIIINLRPDVKTVEWTKKAVALFGVILTEQILQTVLYHNLSLLNPLYKQYIVIPYGGSNVIAAILVPILCMVFREKWALWAKTLLIVFYALGIILTRSFGGIALAVLCVLYQLYFAEGKKRSIAVTRFAGALFLTLVILLVWFSAPIQNLIEGKITAAGGNVLDGLANGRLQLWEQSMNDLRKNNWLFGYGMQSISVRADGGAGAHNILMDLLLKCGLIGMLNYLIMFAAMIKRGRKAYQETRTGFFIMIIVIYLNSLYEVCYFSYPCDTLLWMFIGIMMAQHYDNSVKSNGR